MLLLLLSLPLTLAQFPTDSCFVEGEACNLQADNLLSSISGVQDFDVCRQLCKDTDGCEYISHFGSESFPLRDYCLLFSSCDNLSSCEDCSTEDILCPPCGKKFEGVVGNNTNAIISGITSEIECKRLCSEKNSCQVYTYHNNEDQLFSNTCILLTKIMEPLQLCEHCSTGFQDCRNTTGGICKFSVGNDGNILTSYHINKTGETSVSLFTLGECELKVVAVGGGGRGSVDDAIGGGGSGYVNTTSVWKFSSSSLVVTVGGPGRHSSVMTPSGEDIIHAAPGEDNNGHFFGGAGYSGGGSGGSAFADQGDGGEDGGDGCCDGGGGAGSGLDVSSINLQQFSLTPGSGGQKLNAVGLFFGGGGGGVLVDGEGPRNKSWDGEGYGGGMGGFGDGYEGSPGSGVVLIEIHGED